MSTQDDNPFLSEFGDIKPLKQDKVTLSSTEPDKSINHTIRQNSAEKFTNKDLNFLIDSPIEHVQPQEELCYKVDGIQTGVFKNLKRGKYHYQDSLDLHRHTVAEARQALFSFINRAIKDEYRCLLITHGKGERSNPPARIKSYVSVWLKQFEQVIAYHSAQPKHGGTGSLYVLLKKSVNQKLENRERFNQ